MYIVTDYDFNQFPQECETIEEAIAYSMEVYRDDIKKDDVRNKHKIFLWGGNLMDCPDIKAIKCN